MAFAKDQWTRPVKRPDGSVERVRNEKRWGRGKRWLAVWLDPRGDERSKACATKTEAVRYGAAMETDRDRGDYLDPHSGKIRLDELGPRWLKSRSVDPSTYLIYETKWRLHVAPAFGDRQVKSIRPSEIAVWLTELGGRLSPATARLAYLVLYGCLELAVADERIKRNPAKSSIVKPPSDSRPNIVAWSDETVGTIIREHPDEFQLIPLIGAACGLRQGEIFGLSPDDFDFEEGTIKVRRQLKRIGKEYVFSLPKSDQERFVPMPPLVAQKVNEHFERFSVLSCTLPWERVDGEPITVSLLFQWRDGRHIRARTYDTAIWRPALAVADVISKPVMDGRSRMRYKGGNRRTGMHALRHYYASVTLADGVNVKELAEYLGHHDAGFTLRLYAHLLPTSHARARSVIEQRLAKLSLLPTEQPRSKDDQTAA